MNIIPFSIRPFMVNAYIIENEATKEAILVDPGNVSADIDQYLEEKELSLKAILLTHAHADHILGLQYYVDKHAVEVYVHEADQEMLKNADYNLSTSFQKDPFTYHKARSIQDGDRLNLAGLTIEVLHTPGHTKGGVCFVIGENILSGDTLFARSIGRFDLYGGSEATLFNSIRTKLYPLVGKTVYPGHGPTTTIDDERTKNSFVRA